MVVGMPNVGKSSLINALRRNYLRKGELFSVSPTHDCGAPWKVPIHIQTQSPTHDCGAPWKVPIHIQTR